MSLICEQRESQAFLFSTDVINALTLLTNSKPTEYTLNILEYESKLHIIVIVQLDNCSGAFKSIYIP